MSPGSRQNPHLVGLSVCLRGFPAEETPGDRIVLGIANLVLRFWNNVLNRGHAFGAFQMIRQDAFKLIGRVPGGSGHSRRRRHVPPPREDRTDKDRAPKPDDLLPLAAGAYTEIGWSRQFLTAAVNFTSVRIRDRAVSKQWRAIR